MQEPLMTSLAEIAQHEPCEQGWDALLKHLAVFYEPLKIRCTHDEDLINSLSGCGCVEHYQSEYQEYCTKNDPTPFKVSEIGKLGKIGWLCWTFCLFKDSDKAARRVYIEFGVWCAEQVRHLLTDARSIKALDVCREYIAGTATLEEIKLMYTSEELESNSPERICSKHAAYSVSMVTSSLAGHTYTFESAAYHAAMAIGTVYFSDEAYEKERGVQLAKLMELLDAGVRNEAPTHLINETGHEL